MKHSSHLINTAFELECSYSKYMLKGMCQAITAHTIVLAEKKVIPKSKKKKIFTVLKKLLKGDYKRINIDKNRIDLFTNIDDFLISKIGIDSGWTQAGKARRESVNISFLITIKELVLEFEKALIYLALKLDEVSMKNNHIIMNDYTYLQHAQPTTLKHYLSGFIEPIIRDLTRISSVYSLLDTSPGGSGSVNGTSLPVSKKRIAKLLCFENTAAHSRDALWQFDLPLQVLSCILISLANISRLCSELIIWNTKEFNFIDIPEKFCRNSIIMPQKKNPYALSYIRGYLNSVSGSFTEYINMGKEITGFPDSRIFIYYNLSSNLEQTVSVIKLFTDILDGIQFKKNNLSQTLIDSDSFATDLADLLMLRLKLDYKTSYGLIKEYIFKNKSYTYKNFRSFLMQKSLNAKVISEKAFISATASELLVNSRPELARNKNINRLNIDSNYKNFFKQKIKYNYTKKNKISKIDKNLIEAMKNLVNTT